MSEKLKQQIAMLCNNTVRIAVFGILAIIFGKWWIILFSGLFLAYEKSGE